MSFIHHTGLRAARAISPRNLLQAGLRQQAPRPAALTRTSVRTMATEQPKHTGQQRPLGALAQRTEQKTWKEMTTPEKGARANAGLR